MLFLLKFLLKVLYSIWYLIRVFFQFIWKFDTKSINWDAPTMSFSHDESEGWYCRNLLDFWMENYTQCEERKIRWQQDRDTDPGYF